MKNLRAFCCYLFVIAMLITGCSRSPQLPAIPAGNTVLAFGDSVTFGYGANPGEDWPTLLAQASGWKIVNAGIVGDTVEAGKNRLPALLEQHKPALVIIEIGGNDFLRHRSQAAVKEDLRQMIATVRAGGAQPVLVAVPELTVLAVVSNKASDAPIYAELGKEEKVPLISNVFSQVLSTPSLCSDKIHPNAQGYRQMAEGIQAALKKDGLLR